MRVTRAKSVGEIQRYSTRIGGVTFHDDPAGNWVEFESIAHLLNPTPKPDVAGENKPTVVKSGHICKSCGAWIPLESHGTYCKEKKP